MQIFRSSIRILSLAVFTFCAVSPALYSQNRFQQKVDHHLAIELDDVRHVVTGTDSIIYHNNSPDTLRSIYFHIWPNAFQPGSTLSEKLLLQRDAVLHHARKEEQGNISGLLFRVNGGPVRWEFLKEHNDICRVDLLTPLLPDSKAVITVMFRLKIPRHGAGDLGHSRQSYFLSNWYPKPALYTSRGWQYTPMIPNGGFPGEYGDYTVRITLPRNYVVASTGRILDDPDEEKWMDNLNDKTRKINRWGRRESAGFPASSGRTKTLTLVQKNTNDFALCLDKRFHYLSDTLQIGDDNRVIKVMLYFTVIEGTFWSGSMEAVKRAVRFMTNSVGEYPYDHISVVQSPWQSGNSAFPALIKVGTVFSPYLLEEEMVRGIAKHWFSASVAINACKEPWLRNGLSGTFAMRYLRENYSDSLSIQDILLDPGVIRNFGGMDSHPPTWLDYLKMRFLQEDEAQPAILPAAKYTARNYTTVAELKSAFSFYTLAEYIGDEQFTTLIRSFYNDWEGRHPTGEDFLRYLHRYSSEETATWFHDQLLAGSKWPDYRIRSLRRAENGYLLTVKNVSGVEVPYPVTISSPAGDRLFWVEGHGGNATINIEDTANAIRKITIDREYILPELQRHDNTIRTRGVFRKVEPLKIVPFAAVPDPYKTQVSLAPVAGWNHTNGFMAGIAAYSNPIIPPNTEYLLMPMYANGNNDLAGTGRIEHRLRPDNGLISRIDIGAEIKRYGYETKNRSSDTSRLSLSYERIMPYAEFHFRKSSPLDPGKHRIRFRSIYIRKDVANPENSVILDKPESYYVNEVRWIYRAGRVLNPFSIQASLQQSGGVLRLMSEENWFINYSGQGKGFSIRLFSGVVLLKPSENTPYDYRFTTSGIAMNTGSRFNVHDPLFDHLYLARNQVPGILRQHMYLTDGGFRRITTAGNNDRWMVTTNMSTTMPGFLPFQLYLDAGIFADAGSDKFFDAMFLYSSGVKVTLMKHVAEIYFPFPFMESKEFARLEELNRPDISYFQKIRFVLNLHLLNPLKLPQKIRF